MKLYGLTGGVGMGKSTAAGFLLTAGAKVIDTDDIARDLVQPGRPALVEIASAFGNNLLTADGQLRRDELAKIVFSDPGARQKLEEILHPRIREQWQKQVAGWRQTGCAIAVVIIPLLFETQAEKQFDKIICIACSLISQRERLAGRGWTSEQASRRIAAQMPVDEKMARSHYVVWTEGLSEVSHRQLAEILKKS